MILYLLVFLLLAACSSSPQRTYYEAQEAYQTAWNTYHDFWVALPETDPRKAQWVKDYHPKFLSAANLLLDWGQGKIEADPVNAAIDVVQKLLIQLSIRKGG